MSDGASTLNAIIIDDEPPARRRLRTLLEPLIAAGRIRLLGEATDGVEALEKLEALAIDLAFLDIQMPGLNGFDVLERVSPSRRPIVIFTTAYDTYALRAFEANAVDYLLKPVAKDRLLEAVERAGRIKSGPQGRRASDERLEKLLDWLDAQEERRDRPKENERREYLRQLSVPYRDRILLIPVDRLVSAEINEGITRIHVLEDDQKPRLRHHVVSYTLDQLESLLPPDRFMRVHRSAIVHLDHVLELIPWFSGRYKLHLAGGHEVVASRERSKQLKDTLMI